MSKRTILHVIESYGGGVATALDSYVESLRMHGGEFEHHLLASIHGNNIQETAFFGKFASVTHLPQNPMRAIAEIRRTEGLLKPEIVHAHSSFAGLYVRMAISSKRVPVVYSPHCFAFQREDVNPPIRFVFRQMERLLTHRTTAIAACSEHEAKLARQLNRKLRVVYVPNISNFPSNPKLVEEKIFDVAMLGRIVPQKDPHFFIEFLRSMRDDFAVRAIWIGGGDKYLEDDLIAEGVEVTGWVSNSQIPKILSTVRVYVHTAAWEGFPVSILEAKAARLPMVVREIGALKGLGSAWIQASPVEMARRAKDLMQEKNIEQNRLFWDALLSKNSPAQQAASLLFLYAEPGAE